MSTSDALREVFTTGRPLIAQWLDVAAQISALRDVATAKGLDWSQVKALLKAQVQDELDEDGSGKRVRKIVERAEFASAYADMLGLGNLNENNYSEPAPPSQAVVAAAVEAQPLDTAEEDDAARPSSSAPIQPETANQSTEAGTARRDNSTEGNPAPVALDPEAATTPPAAGRPPVDTHSPVTVEASSPTGEIDVGGDGGASSSEALEHGQDDAEQSAVAAIAPAIDEPGDPANGGGSDEAVTPRPNSTQQAGAGEGETSSAPGSNILKLTNKPRRPYCQKPGDPTCAGYGPTHCGKCEREHRLSPIAVEAGGVSIPHHGEVA